MVKVGCFFGNTSYGNQFIGIDGSVKPQSIRPKHRDLGNKKFESYTSYKDVYASAMHNELTTGSKLSEVLYDSRRL